MTAAVDTLDEEQGPYHSVKKIVNAFGDIGSAERCLDAASKCLNFSIAELWTFVSDPTATFKDRNNTGSKPSCIYVLAQPATLEAHRAKLVGIWNSNRMNKIHIISPGLCEKAWKNECPLWFTPNDKDSPLHNHAILKTAVAIPFTVDSMEKDYCAIFFSTSEIPCNRISIEFLLNMSKAGVISIRDIIEKRPSPAMDDIEEEEPTIINDVTVMSHIGERIDTNVNWNELSDVEFLVHGNRCSIYTAMYKQKPCVVKMLRKDIPDTTVILKELEAEMNLLLKIRHENFVKLYGAGKCPERFLILERVDGGTLAQRCGSAIAVRDRRKRFKKKKSFSYRELLKCSRQIASGLKYLHDDALPGNAVIHRDLKPDNIGFTADGDCMILDLGLATIIPRSEVLNQTYSMTGQTGSLRYMAPEVAESRPYNEKVDVHSYSMILWEMMNMRKPYDNLGRNEFFSSVVRCHKRPQISKRCPKDFSKLLQDCWDEDYKKRPSSAQICSRLDEMLQDLPIESPTQVQVEAIH